ncbi:hypothetical protein FZEAL_5374 [Fusarium zealandicum]|uniref:Right handed beta helix domain-containing protein n=1 Tax=Fusarium zealandicum TaxID=1053134 RepID=A0A8H4UJZ9_9HYPO|nr:hypothetical protein FZEAL_5374 [Fusarium zealandicum]
MKFTSALVTVASLGFVTASPFSNANDPAGLEGIPRKVSVEGQDLLYPQTWHVKPRQSIQHAIKSASRGDHIVVEAGTYREQLTINKDGIELIGHGAILTPPKKAVKNQCSGLSGENTEVGICVIGTGVKLSAFQAEHRRVLSVKKPVKDVSVSGFDVRGFSGINIAVVGAKNARVVNNKLTDGAKYGALTLGSYDTFISNNKVTATLLGFIGICNDNFSGVLITKNHVANHIIGLCIQTPGADIQYNEVTASCFGAFVDPGVKGAKIRHNHFGPSNAACEKIGVSGIILDGAIKTLVRDNVIEGQKNGGTGAGIVVVDDECNKTGPELSLSCIILGRKAVSKDNLIIGNTLRDNDFDLFINTAGSGNVAKCNTCSTPAALCAM